eukprot:TRINITY_DN1582_c2_g1_i1.p1 TRINITY_DN1582_c2_g1~~TRINITY_DN1582_c2_g1_i1.p1  ORF type:complete len:488 (+),score=71.29 TRINITY_DN1582_c2_g1_i1:62-1465(+)
MSSHMLLSDTRSTLNNASVMGATLMAEYRGKRRSRSITRMPSTLFSRTLSGTPVSKKGSHNSNPARAESPSSNLRWKKKDAKTPKKEEVKKHQPTPETLARAIDQGDPPCCSLYVLNNDRPELLLIEACAWGQIVIALQRQRSKVGRVSCVVLNQQTRTMYITGADLPTYGIPLQLPKKGFKSALSNLRHVLTEAGVLNCLDITVSPDIDLIDPLELAEDSALLDDIPPCKYKTDAVVMFINRYATARFQVSEELLAAYKKQFHSAGIAIDTRGEQWCTKDGRRGPIPWIDKAAALASPLYFDDNTNLLNLDPAYNGITELNETDFETPLRKSVKSTRFGRSHSTPDRYRSRTPTKPKEVWKPSGCSPGLLKRNVFQHESVTHSVLVNDPQRKRVITDHYEIGDLAEDNSYVIGPCVLHIPEGTTVNVDPEYGLPSLRVVMHEGGRLVTSAPRTEEEITTDNSYIDI